MSDIRYELHGAVALITIDRADRMNSLDFAANDLLVECWRRFDKDDTARVAVITGAGAKAFCAGADLKTYTIAFATRPAPEFRRRFTDGPGFGGITRSLDIGKPIIAAINGFAISGGFELALACDVRFCSPNAEFALQDVKWGFHACDGGLVRLPQIVGLGNAMEIVLSGERIGAQHADRARQSDLSGFRAAFEDDGLRRDAGESGATCSTVRQGRDAALDRDVAGRGAQA
jgi:enoyl-CoA hydratase/carnithine racemase